MEIIESFSLTIWSIAKVFVLVGLLLYIVFAYVVDSQVRLMNDTIEVGFEKEIRTIAKMHFILSVIVFILAIIIL
jgi:hypothetical protein